MPFLKSETLQYHFTIICFWQDIAVGTRGPSRNRRITNSKKVWATEQEWFSSKKNNIPASETSYFSPLVQKNYILICKLYSYKCSKITKEVRWERAKFCDQQTDSKTVQLSFSQAQQEWSYSEESISTSLGNRTISTMIPKKLEFLQESHSGRRKKMKSGAIQSRILTLERDFIVLMTCQITIRELMGQWWVSEGQSSTLIRTAQLYTYILPSV